MPETKMTNFDTIRSTEKQVVILGFGAVGKLLGSQLNNQGWTVSAIERDSFKDSQINCRRHRITVKHTQQDNDSQYETHVRTITKNEPITQLIVTTKSYNTLDAIKDITPFIGPHTTICIIQNGLGALDEIDQWLNHINLEAKLCHGITTHGIKPSGSHTITHTGHGETIIPSLGLPYPYEVMKTDPNIVEKIWLKLIVNSAINPLTAIYNIANGELLSPQFKNEFLKLAEESALIAFKYTQQLTGESQNPSQSLKAYIETAIDQCCQVAKSTALNSSSMREDILHGRPTEIDYINGFLVKQAQKYAIEVPLNAKMLDQIRLLSQSKAASHNEKDT